MNKGVENILEVIQALQILAVSGTHILKDGVDISDLPALIDLAKQYPVFVSAVKDIGEIPDEVKDISGEECVLIVQSLVKAIEEIKAAAAA